MATYPPTPQQGTFPPIEPTTLTAAIPSYLYQQYADDPDLRAFVRSYNAIATSYANWFATVALGAYTSNLISDGLLDWIARGIYGFQRPALPSGRSKIIGTLGTYRYGTRTIGTIRLVGPANISITSDDVFKRIITWNFYKGDGNRFTVRWLKRRVARFLSGTDGAAPNIDQTYAISVTFGGSIVNIRIGGGARKIVGGALYGRLGFGRMIPYGSLQTIFESGPNPPEFANAFKAAMDSGVLQVPFQYTFAVTVPNA